MPTWITVCCFALVSVATVTAPGLGRKHLGEDTGIDGRIGDHFESSGDNAR